MKPIVWSKIYWADLRAEPELHACSLEARGLWLELLCLAAPRGGYLADDGTPMSIELIAAMVHEPVKKIERLMSELETRRVFRRDARDRIYAPRLLKDAKLIRDARENGRKGGRASHDNQRGIFARSDPRSAPRSKRPPDSKSQESEAISQEPEASSSSTAATASASPVAPIVRAAAAMGTSLEVLHRFPQWLFFEHAFATWLADGCDAERDIWPVMTARAVKLGRLPVTPSYFGDAVREARDRRLAACAPGSAAPAPDTWVSPERQADRRAAYAETGHWPAHWGPKPDGETEIRDQESGISRATQTLIPDA